MPVTQALLLSKNSRLNANTLSLSRVPLPTSLAFDFNPLVDFIARDRPLQTIEFRDFRPDVILSMQKRALIRASFKTKKKLLGRLLE